MLFSGSSFILNCEKLIELVFSRVKEGSILKGRGCELLYLGSRFSGSLVLKLVVGWIFEGKGMLLVSLMEVLGVVLEKRFALIEEAPWRERWLFWLERLLRTLRLELRFWAFISTVCVDE